MWKILALPWNLLWSKNFQYRRVEGMTRSPISRSFNFFRIASPMTFWSFYPPPISEANPKKKWSGSGRDLGQKSQSENFAGNKAFQSLSESSEKPSLLLLICWKVASSAERSQLVGRLLNEILDNLRCIWYSFREMACLWIQVKPSFHFIK